MTALIAKLMAAKNEALRNINEPHMAAEKYILTTADNSFVQISDVLDDNTVYRIRPLYGNLHRVVFREENHARDVANRWNYALSSEQRKGGLELTARDFRDALRDYVTTLGAQITALQGDPDDDDAPIPGDPPPPPMPPLSTSALEGQMRSEPQPEPA